MNFSGSDNLGNPYLDQLSGVHDALPDVSVDRMKIEAQADAILRRALLRNGYVRNEAGELEFVGASVEAEPVRRSVVTEPPRRKRPRRKTSKTN